MSLPPDWREQLIHVVRGAAPPDPSWFRGGPALSPRDQIEVYRDQYAMRLFDAIVEETPGFCHLAGERRGELVRAYLADHPSRSWTLNRVADALVDWLGARDDIPAAWVDMARLDRAVMKGFEAAAGTPTPIEALGAMPPLELQPHVRLLRVGAAVHRVRSALLSGANPVPEPEPGDFTLVVYRADRKMRHVEMNPWAWQILTAIDGGADVGSALEQTVAAGCPVPLLQSSLAGWFQFFAERQLVQLKR